MPICATCHRDVPDGSRFCPHCANPIPSAPVIPTMTSPPKPAEASYHSGFGSSSSDSIDDARFTPGTMLAERYRIVGLLGKGGMGEVYRADDLKLRQPVALKFLPEALSQDPKKLERFLHEVRVARQVSHPNVCRVYDIAESDGQHFISMEYVDGEDLSAVLRRMGRPSKEKALQIARQLCAGLAAAHDKGVLHRDLKPHNVMIDGQGRVRITDFGLAGFAEDFTGKEVYAGTPAYMSPEQLAGRGVSVKSDIYSLGVVLSELFTGKRLFEGTSREQLQRSRTSAPTTLATLSDDLDPAVERVILRCLEPDPTARPSSALAVAAALPGGDPLAAALAAGETPSPEMVANAGDVGGMRPAPAIACLLGIVLGTIAMMFLRDSMLKHVPLEKPSEVLADRAKEILKKIGHTTPARDSAYGWGQDWEFIRHVEDKDKSASRWDRLNSQRPSPITFWYRQSPRTMVPPDAVDRVVPWEKPFFISGLADVWLDEKGRLTGLKIDPPQREDAGVSYDVPYEVKPTDWSVLFAEAGLDQTLFTPSLPRWTPEHFCDERAAWEGHYSNQPDLPIRLEAGANRGKPNWLSIIHPWTRPDRMQDWPETFGEKAASMFWECRWWAVILAGIVLARRNVRLRRGDRTGATRLAMALLCLSLASNLLGITHVADRAEFGRVMFQISQALLGASMMWVFYVALEPYVRRRWPHVLISWGRLLAGRFRDPSVGRDILIGGVLQIAVMLVHQVIEPRLKVLSGAPPDSPSFWLPPTLLGGRDLWSGFFNVYVLYLPFLSLFIFFGLRLILRKDWLAVVGMVVLWCVPAVFGGWNRDAPSMIIIGGLAEAAHGALIALALLRFGLLACAFMSCFASFLWDTSVLDFTTWYSAGPALALVLVLALAAYGFHTALAGRPLFKDELQEA